MTVWHTRASKLADILHKSLVTVMAMGCIGGSINIGYSFYNIYNKLQERKLEAKSAQALGDVQPQSITTASGAATQ
jgi:maleate cis-trans isomerase